MPANMEPQPTQAAATPPAEAWAHAEEVAEPLRSWKPSDGPLPTEQPSEGPQSITVEVPIYDDHRATPAVLEAVAEPARKTTVTRELPAIPEDEVLTEPERAQAVAESQPVELLDAPMFVSPRGGAVAESMIDEVDAAFITAGLPAAEPVASQEAMTAAAALEDIAEMLRAGEIELRPAPGTTMTSKESALATVLAALLAKR